MSSEGIGAGYSSIIIWDEELELAWSVSELERMECMIYLYKNACADPVKDGITRIRWGDWKSCLKCFL